MSDLSNKCVLLKGLPPHFLQGDLEKVLKNGGFFSGVDKIQDHLERQNDKRWIILFKTEEDATKCFNGGKWLTEIENETVSAIPDFCSECIIPEEWKTAPQRDQSWVLIQDQDRWSSVSSVSSSELFAGGTSLPFQPSGTELTSADTETNTEVYKNIFEDDGRCTTDEIEIKSDSFLFGSGYKQHLNVTDDTKKVTDSFTFIPESGNQETKAGKIRDSGEKQEASSTVHVSSNTTKPPVSPRNIPPNQKQFESEVLPTLPSAGGDEGMTPAFRGSTQSPTITKSDNFSATYVIQKVSEPSSNVATNAQGENSTIEARGSTATQSFEIYSAAPGQRPAAGQTPAADQRQSLAFEYQKQPDVHDYAGQQMYQSPLYHAATPFVYVPGYGPMPVMNPSQPAYPTPHMAPAAAAALYQSPMFFYPPPPQAGYPPHVSYPTNQNEPSMSQAPPPPPQTDNEVNKQVYPQAGISAPDVSEYLTPVQIGTAAASKTACNSKSVEHDLHISEVPHSPERDKVVSESLTSGKRAPMPLPKPMPVPKQRSSKSQAVHSGDKSQKSPNSPEIKTQLARTPEWDDLKEPSDQGLHATDTVKTEEPLYEEIPADAIQDDMKPVNVPTERPLSSVQGRKLPSLPTEKKKAVHYRKSYKSMDIIEEPEESASKVPTETDEERLGEVGETNEELGEEKTNKIIVTGRKETTSLDNLTLFFENKRKTGGGEAVNVELKTDPDAVIIEFKDSSVVTSVLQKQENEPFKLEGAELVVNAYTPPPVDTRKVFLTGLKEGLSSESLEMFVEVISGMPPDSIVYGETPGTVLLTFEQAPDFARIEQELKKRTLEENVVSAAKVDVSSIVKVTGYGNDISEDTLLLYFENKRRSGGGEVMYMKKEENRSLVQFKQTEDSERVCDGREHVLGNSQMSVCLYYKCLDWDKNFAVQIPDPLEISDLDPYVMKFIRTSRYKDLLENNLMPMYGILVWPVSGSGSLQIHCTIDPKLKQSVSLVKQWEQNCRKTVYELTDTIDVKEDICVLKEIWSKVMEALQGIDVPNPDDVAISPKKDELKLVIFGLKDAVVELSKTVRTIVANLENKEMEDSTEITKKVVIKMFQLALLNSLKFFDPNNFSARGVTVDVIGRELIFCGRKISVDQVVSTMTEQLQGFAKKSFSASKTFKDMMFEKEVRDYIKTAMMKRKVLGVWDVVKGDDQVYMYSKTNDQAQTAIDIVTKCLLEKTIPLDIRMEELIDGDSGKTFIKQLLSNHSGLLKLERTTGQLTIVTVDNLMEKVYDEVVQFLELHVIREEFIDVESGKLCFINQFYRESLEQISNQYRGLSVVIEEQETEYRHGFRIKGQKDGCRLAIKKLQSVTENVFCDEHTLKSIEYDVSQFFQSSQGRNHLCQIEMKEKCILKINFDGETSPRSSLESSLIVHGSCMVKDLKISVIEGDITKIQDTTDVLVCPRNRYLTKTEGLASTIVQRGGYEIQKDIETYAKSHEMSDGDVVIGKPGKLKCKHVFHAILPEWRGGDHNEERLLRMAVTNCLDKAAVTKASAIALPAVGTGRFGFPENKALSSLICAIKSFLDEKGTFSVKEIHLCAVKDSVVRGFIEELRKQFGDITKMRLKEKGGRSIDKGKRTSGTEMDELQIEERSSRRRSPISEYGRKIKVAVVTDELAKQKVDVIINSTNINLDLKVGTISKSLLKLGGEVLMQDLQSKYPDGIKIGEVAVSTGGNLQCKEVYHGVMTKWDKGEGTSEKVMAIFVKRCLELADNRGMISVAFPALGTGVLGFPADFVASLFFGTIQDYESNNPESGIRSVLLVVYQDDIKTAQAFKFVQDKMRSGRMENRRSFAHTFSMTSADLGTSHRFNIRTVAVTVLQGDITQEKTDFVVNSTIEELNLSTGAVSKAILDAAGTSLQLECHSEENLQNMKTNGFIVTGPGKMMCGRILHIKARSKASNWEETVKTCLQAVEDKGGNSISFPALGTGGKGCSPDSVAKAMFSAFKQYIQSSDYKSTLKTIRVVIFQENMVKVFINASKEESRSSRRLFERLRPKQKESKVRFRIYADSAYKTGRVKELLDDIFVEDKLYPRKQTLEDLKDWQVDNIERMAHDKNLGINISPRHGYIKLTGANDIVKDTKTEIDLYLNRIEKDADVDAKKAALAAAARSSISLPKSWGRMKLTDATLIVPLPATDLVYTAVLKNFQLQAGGYFTRIVKIERIQNPTLYTQYIAKKKQMELANKTVANVERTLWHGTSGQAVDNINNKGFDRNYNSGASHGVGVYFAVNALTSVRGYCSQDSMGQRHIYVARVLTGDFCAGQGATRLPPAKPSGIPMDRYDSTTDNPAAPSFFVIFHDAQAYPEFLITFI